MNFSEHFKKSEFECKCGCEMPVEVQENLIELCKELEVIRQYSKTPLKINSAYRCPSHNKSIGGVSKSQHILGNAADIVAIGILPNNTRVMMEHLIYDGYLSQGGVGTYNSFTHYDIGYDRKRRRW